MMAMSFDFSQIRSVARGEVNGSLRFLATAFGAAAAWIAVSRLSDMSASASSTLALQEERYNSLTVLAAEYKNAAPSSVSRGMDAMTAFTQVSSRINLGSRVGRVVPTSDGKCSVEISRLYAEELTDMVRELSNRGMRVLSAQIRALPAGQERLFSLEALIGADSQP
ncbi:MAG: type II secretion system protein M [Synergistaceae bacterium]|jgi:hypothetical protein|nr:type II secretion system protein M [Synergistaceae bacterium]